MNIQADHDEFLDDDSDDAFLDENQNAGPIPDLSAEDIARMDANAKRLMERTFDSMNIWRIGR